MYCSCNKQIQNNKGNSGCNFQMKYRINFFALWKEKLFRVLLLQLRDILANRLILHLYFAMFAFFFYIASNMDPKKIIGCSQPYDLEELVVPLWDADVSNIKQFFDQAGAMIGKYLINYVAIQRVFEL